MAERRIFFKPDEPFIRRVTRVRLLNSQCTKTIKRAVLERALDQSNSPRMEETPIMGATRDQWLAANSAVIIEES